jgi:hypothetical protein
MIRGSFHFTRDVIDADVEMELLVVQLKISLLVEA